MQINELTENYFKAHPRSFDDKWPSDRYTTDDRNLRRLFEEMQTAGSSSVKLFQTKAKTILGVEFSDDQTGWRATDLLWKRREGEMADQVGAA